jgi:hypothetical protein
VKQARWLLVTASTSDAALQKVATLTGSGNSSASALADSLSKGTGASGSKHTQKELF